jgi:hypothetical protein
MMVKLIGKDVAKISTNKLNALIFDFTFISLHVLTFAKGSLHSILNYTTICWLVFVTTELYLGSKDKPNLLLAFLSPFLSWPLQTVKRLKK